MIRITAKKIQKFKIKNNILSIPKKIDELLHLEAHVDQVAEEQE